MLRRKNDNLNTSPALISVHLASNVAVMVKVYLVHPVVAQLILFLQVLK